MTPHCIAENGLKKLLMLNLGHAIGAVFRFCGCCHRMIRDAAVDSNAIILKFVVKHYVLRLSCYGQSSTCLGSVLLWGLPQSSESCKDNKCAICEDALSFSLLLLALGRKHLDQGLTSVSIGISGTTLRAAI